MLKKCNAVTLELTNRCDLRCRICNIWKERPRYDLAFADIQKFFSHLSRPAAVSLTGGEPFLHPEINRIIRYFSKLWAQKKITNIDIATNAYSAHALSFFRKNRKLLRLFSFSVSLDGLGAAHAAQRGRPDAFTKTLKNIIVLRKYGVPVNIKFVISRINYTDVYPAYLLAKKLQCTFYPKFFEKAKNYYHRRRPYPALAVLNQTHKSILADIEAIYRSERHRIRGLALFSLKALREYIRKQNLSFIQKCRTPATSLFIASTGEIYSCVYQKKVGGLKDWPRFDAELFSKIAKDASRGTCPRCLAYHGYLKECNVR